MIGQLLPAYENMKSFDVSQDPDSAEKTPEMVAVGAPIVTDTAGYRERESCGLCEHQAMKKQRDIGSFPILECNSCGFLQTGRLVDSQTLESYYRSGYGGLRQRQGQEVNSEVNFQLLKKVDAIKPRIDVLDIGCGYGFLLRMVQDHCRGKATGVELAVAERDFAKNTLNLDVRASSDELDNQLYDLVVLFEVIEHIAEPVAFMQKIVRHLKRDGVLVCCTDNFRSSLVESMGDRFPKWIPHQHLSLFDPVSLPHLMEISGLSVEQTISFTPWELELQRAAMRLTRGRIGGKVFSLQDEVHTENSRPYRYFALRKKFNQLWARFTSRSNLGGELMLVAARKQSA